jgi:uncharacterized protein
MGTFHVRDKECFKYFPKAQDLIGKCTHYYGEVDLGKIDPALVSASFTMEDKFRYSQYYSKKKYQKIKYNLQKYFDFDITADDQFAPIFLQGKLVSIKFDSSMDYSLDQSLYLEAMSKDLICGGIESPLDQYRIAKSLDLKIQHYQFKKFIQSPHKFISSYQKLRQYYIEGDEQKLYKKAKSSLGGFKQIMLNQRNDQMLKNILPILEKENAFIAVGAAHLFGNIGLLAGAKKNDWKITSL